MQTLDRTERRRICGQRLICGIPSPQLDAEAREILNEVQPLGVILFARNVESPEQVCELNRELKAFVDRPLLLCVDQEGGRVARIRAPATEWPTAQALSERDDPTHTERVAYALNLELRAMNFDVNFAPVLDVATNPDNPVIGDRAWGETPEIVSRHALAWIRGMQRAGVAPCGKHFPGHGDTDVDSHVGLPEVHHDLDRLRHVEWRPFQEAIAAGLDAIMTAHVVVHALDENRPATLSATAMSPLRQELGFNGLIVSDDLDMAAVKEHYSPDDIIRQGHAAGVDVFLACNDAAHMLDCYAALNRRLEDAPNHQQDIGQSKRIRGWRDRWYHPSTEFTEHRDLIACEAHQKLAAMA